MNRVGDIRIRQVFHPEAERHVWVVEEYRYCAGKYAHPMDSAWILHSRSPIEPFSTRSEALTWIAEIEAKAVEFGKGLARMGTKD